MTGTGLPDRLAMLPNHSSQLDWERLIVSPAPNGKPDGADWNHWLRKVSIRRRSIDRVVLWNSPRQRRALLAHLTCTSFQLDGHAVTPALMLQAIAPGVQARGLRSRLTQRLRNHLAILQQIELDLHKRRPLKPAAVVRWYTSVSSGLSTASLGEAQLRRLEEMLQRINGGHLRMAMVVQEAARIHLGLLSDPLVPGFNRILARLLLHYHLGRCGLPPVFFTSADQRLEARGELPATVRLLQLLDTAYDTLATLRAPVT